MTEGRELREMIVRGRVQGVGFRWWTKTLADDLGVAGKVRNMPDRSVRVVAVGSPEAVERLESMLRHGPRLARVDEVEVVRAESMEPGVGGRAGHPGWSTGSFVIER